MVWFEQRFRLSIENAFLKSFRLESTSRCESRTAETREKRERNERETEMVDSKVETISRLAQWRIENFGPCSFKKSDPFKVGIWNWYRFLRFSSLCDFLWCICFMFRFSFWNHELVLVSWLAWVLIYLRPVWNLRHLSIEKNRYMYIRLFPELSRASKEQPPIARFVLRVSNAAAARRPYISPGKCFYYHWCFSLLCI